MSEQFRLADIEYQGRIPFTDGKEMNKFAAVLERPNGERLTDVALWRFVDDSENFTNGCIVEGEIKNQPKGGLKLTGAKVVSDAAPASAPPAQPAQPAQPQVWDYTHTDSTAVTPKQESSPNAPLSEPNVQDTTPPEGFPGVATPDQREKRISRAAAHKVAAMILGPMPQGSDMDAYMTLHRVVTDQIVKDLP